MLSSQFSSSFCSKRPFFFLVFLFSAQNAHFSSEFLSEYSAALLDNYLVPGNWKCRCEFSSLFGSLIIPRPPPTLWLAESDHVAWMLASDWSKLITWTGHWPLIGRDCFTNTPGNVIIQTDILNKTISSFVMNHLKGTGKLSLFRVVILTWDSSLF